MGLLVLAPSGLVAAEPAGTAVPAGGHAAAGLLKPWILPGANPYLANAAQRPPARIELGADRVRIASDGRDLAFVTARIVDAEGRLVPRASNLLSFEVGGAGELVATDNGDPRQLTLLAGP